MAPLPGLDTMAQPGRLRGSSKVLKLRGDWESEQALMHIMKIIQEIWETRALEKSAHNAKQLLVSLPSS